MGVKLLLEKAHVVGIRTYEVYRREGGYRSVEKALKMATTYVVEDALFPLLRPASRWFG